MKKSTLTIALISATILASAQQQEMVYRSEKDSIQLAEIRNKFLEIHSSGNVEKSKQAIDSVMKLQSEVFKNGVIGFRYVYSANSDFTPFADLENGTVKPSQVVKLSLSNLKGKKFPSKIFDCKNLEELG